MARHLGKTEKEKEIGIQVETYFVSMSPILEWTIHRAGRIRKDHPNENAGLAIFDVKEIAAELICSYFPSPGYFKVSHAAAPRAAHPTTPSTMGTKLRRVRVDRETSWE